MSTPLIICIVTWIFSSCQGERPALPAILPAQKQTPAPALEAEVSLADGSQLHVTIPSAPVVLRAVYGRIPLDLKLVSEISFNPEGQANVIMANGDHLQGSLELDSLEMQTVVGRLRVGTAMLRRVHLTSEGGSASADLMACYRFDGDVLDASGNGNNGTMSSVVFTTDRSGRESAAILFGNPKARVSIPSTPSMHPLDQLTITFWIRVDRIINNYSPILHKGGTIRGDFENREYACYVKSISTTRFQLQFFSAGDGRGQAEILSNGNQPVREWLFVAATFDRRKHLTRLFVNGSLEGEDDDQYSTFNQNDSPMTLGVDDEGSHPDRSPFNGALDDLRLYRRALTPEEIRGLYKP